MKRKSIINLMASIVISCSPILPLHNQNAEAATDNRLTYKFDGFSDDTLKQFSVNGVAEVPAGANFLRLTPSTPGVAGGVFNKTPLNLQNNYSFSTAFSFKMSDPVIPGDGITFTIQSATSSALTGGGGIGYLGIQPSFTVKYDTFYNQVYNDPSANYIGIAENGEVINQPGWNTNLDVYNAANGTNYVLSDGKQYYTWIDYNGLTQNIQVRLGTSPDRASSQKVLDLDNINIAAIFGDKPVYAGFTSGTGAAYENHDILSWYFVNDNTPIDTLETPNDYKQNEPPTAPDDKVTTEKDTPVQDTVVGTDPEGDSLTYTKGKDPEHGKVTVNKDGSYTYTPDTGFVGGDSFTVIIDDGKGGSTEVPITVDVTEPSAPPSPCVGTKVAMINSSFEEGAARGTAYDGSGYFYYESEVPGWKTTDDSAGQPVIELWDWKQNNPPSANTWPAPPNGNKWAELNAFVNGMLYQDVKTTPGQTIYWRLSHMGRLGADTMQLRIGAATANPYDTVVQKQMTDGNTAWGTYTGSYTVPAGQTVTRFGFEAVSTSSGGLGEGAGNFIDDIFLGTSPCGVVTKSVSPVEDVQEGDTLTYSVNFKNNGGDESGNTVFTDNIPDGTEYVPGSLEIISGPNTGKLTDVSGDDQGEFLSSENRVVVRLGNGANASQAGRIPNADVLPDGTTVQFKVKVLPKYKTSAVANQATVEYDNLLTGDHETRNSNGVTVDVNRPPITPDFEETTWKDTTVTGSVYGVDANGDSLTFTQGTGPQNGTVTVNSDGTWTYIPDPDFVGEDSFTVIVSDGKGGTSTSTVTVHVEDPPNQPPVTKNDDVTTQQDTSVTGSVYGTDPDGDNLTFNIDTNPKHGTVIVNSDGTWKYEPDPGYSGPDIFTVTVEDGKGGVTTSTITVNVTAKPNQPPVTRDDSVTTPKNTSVTGSVYGSDPDGDSLTFTKGSDPQHGKVTVNQDGTWTYAPEPGYVGKDSFTVIVDDGRGGKIESKITVDVTEPTPPTNHPPTASDETVTTDKGTSVTGSVYGTDPDGDPLTYTKGKNPEHGTVTVNPDGTYTYTPDPDFVGEDSFTIIVDDGKGGTKEVTITVGVTEPSTPSTPSTPSIPGTPSPTNRPPAASGDKVTTDKGTPVTGTVKGTDPDNDSLTYSKGKDPEHGTVTVKPDGTWSYTPDPSFIGEDSFTVIVDDGKGGKTEVPITIHVKAPNTPPVISDSGNGTIPTNPGNGTPPTDSRTDPTESGGDQTSPAIPEGESSPVEHTNHDLPSTAVEADQTGVHVGSKLPNTATNLYNLRFLGIMMLVVGLILRRKNKA